METDSNGSEKKSMTVNKDVFTLVPLQTHLTNQLVY